MIFCQKCFVDPEIIAIIEDIGGLGICPVCGAKEVYLYDTDSSDMLEGFFDNLLAVYTAESDLPDTFPRSETKSLGETLKHDWHIFANISEDTIVSIVKSLSTQFFSDYPQLFDQRIGILEKHDIEFLKQHSILHTEKWSDFVEAIKHKNRFHTNLVDTALLKDYCIAIAKDIPVGKQRFYRGRIARNEVGFKPSEMGPPPCDVVGDGRANSAGISRLYLTDNRETTFHEIRAAEFDYISIGTFKALKPLRVVDLKRIALISPFSGEVDCTVLAINSEHLRRINAEMSKTMRRGDSALDYLPTQYIADFVKSITNDAGEPVFDGIEYQSAMHSRGSNLTIFYPEKLKCTYSRTYEVTKLVYRKKVTEK